ncbi:MAG: ATP synthase subunit C [Thermotogae bacterium]|jgi:V/A-type H+-transporting ATPase subunit K|nr:ATP synthase subunit C [Thermotogota bacterium]
MSVSVALITVVIATTIVLGIILTSKKVMKKISSPVKVGKGILGMNMGSVITFSLIALLSMIPDGRALAATTAAATSTIVSNGVGLGLLGAGLSTGLAAIGAGIGVGIAGAAGIGAISEKPEMLGRTLIYVGLAEGVAIYGLIISIMILGRI